MANALPSSVSLRAGLRAAGRMTGWDRSARNVAVGYAPRDVKMHCVENVAWQKVRLSLKGKDTVEKLEVLEAYWDNQMAEANRLLLSGIHADHARGSTLQWATEVQVGNYLGALKRGGQIDNDYKIRKAR